MPPLKPSRKNCRRASRSFMINDKLIEEQRLRERVRYDHRDAAAAGLLQRYRKLFAAPVRSAAR
jgi:excinuclease UvrABC helicase subunit UvrB